LAAAFLALAMSAPAQEKQQVIWKVGDTIDTVEKLGAEIPADLEFFDTDRKPVNFRQLLTKPTILNLVYITCPSICSPLMRELARVVDKVEMEPGKEFQVITLSFDPREHWPEKAKMVKNAEQNIIKAIKRDMPAGSWRFYTGTWENIARLCATVGFQFAQNKDGEYDHPAATIFISSKGKVVRYLHGVELLPANVEMAINDTMLGRERSVMRKVQQLCFSYDPEGNTYVLQVNRIILAASLLLIALFLVFLLRAKGKGKRAAQERAPQEGGGQ